jgi:CTP:molybdopterin cytidylyltransferase MocA
VITGVVLAAGEGKRFGGTKQLADKDGRPLVAHAVEALRGAGVGEILVVSGPGAQRRSPRSFPTTSARSTTRTIAPAKRRRSRRRFTPRQRTARPP